MSGTPSGRGRRARRADRDDARIAPDRPSGTVRLAGYQVGHEGGAGGLANLSWLGLASQSSFAARAGLCRSGSLRRRRHARPRLLPRQPESRLQPGRTLAGLRPRPDSGFGREGGRRSILDTVAVAERSRRRHCAGARERRGQFGRLPGHAQQLGGRRRLPFSARQKIRKMLMLPGFSEGPVCPTGKGGQGAIRPGRRRGSATQAVGTPAQAVAPDGTHMNRKPCQDGA